MQDKVLDQLRAIGLQVEALEIGPAPGGPFHRVPVVDPKPDKGRKRSGWYLVQEYRTRDGRTLLYGAAGNWKSGAQIKIEPDGKGLDDDERKALAAKRREAEKAAEAERREKAESAAQRATRVWAGLPMQGASQYLDAKGVAGHGVRYARGCIVVPVRRASDDALVGLQWIDPDGAKRFLTGTPKQGACHFIGRADKNGAMLVCEGYATGASLHQATGLPVAVAFDAGNLLPVAEALRKRPDVRMRTLVIAGDDDHETAGNPGATKARAAAEAVSGAAIAPAFENPAGRSDFNDMQAERGLKALRAYLQRAIRQAVDHVGWRRRLNTNRDGKPTATLHNLQLILEHDDRMAGLLRLDEFANKAELTREPPFGGNPREVSDAEVVELAAWFGAPETYAMNVGVNQMHETVSMVAARNKVHPVRSWLQAMAWDGEPRIDAMFPDIFNAKDNEYTRKVARNFFISAVARVMRPGCKADLMLILEGAQGAGKSTAIELLAGPEWFVVQSEPPEAKDFYQILQGRWIVEIAELQSFSKAQVSRVKQAISTPVDVYRASYGRLPREYPRQCVFVGSTNEDEYLRDPTGARRFMPVRVHSVDLEALRLQREQLWAEAVHRFDQGETWWDLPASAEEEREDRYRHDSWAEPLLAWLDGEADYERYPDTRPADGVQQATMDDLLTWGLGLDRARHGPQEQQRVGAILKRAGWERVQRRRDGRRQYVYQRPEGDYARG
ncbi:VapE domain-containing protein [Spectribacter hydrogenooxidans]|uniref:VapE family protein n=1 Tax=Spectribacter hydrogenoxidans TaxID=3075608 RepID=A0ABU3C0J6_9GAMM|nr:VapE domain-containing protein [Salinisphaera sp. W335]MDT0635077.1 VapE family protein [Salinisphaera sp. W335]